MRVSRDTLPSPDLNAHQITPPEIGLTTEFYAGQWNSRQRNQGIDICHQPVTDSNFNRESSLEIFFERCVTADLHRGLLSLLLFFSSIDASGIDARRTTNRNACAASTVFELFDLLARDVKTGVRRRNTRIDRSLQQRFLQVAGFQFVDQAGTHMQSEFFPSPHRSHRGQHQQTPRPSIQTGPCPNRSPRVSSNQFLKLAIE